jgi:hypothetical protein
MLGTHHLTALKVNNPERITALKNWMLERYPDKKDLGQGESSDRKYTLLKFSKSTNQ